jgi:hypothetical protein
MKTVALAVLAAAALLAPASAQSILFNFDNAPPHTPLPIDLLEGGVLAHFDGTDLSFSVQLADFLGFTPQGFGGLCLYPGSFNKADLLIAFDHTLTDFSILYAVNEVDCASAATMRVTVYMDDAYVATATKTGTVGGTWPTSTLAISAPEGFNNVVVHYDSGPPFDCDNWGPIFMADNMRITPMAQPPCYPDFTGDGTLDLFDFLAFVNAFNAQDPSADCVADGTFDLFDFLCFVNAFNAGC